MKDNFLTGVLTAVIVLFFGISIVVGVGKINKIISIQEDIQKKLDDSMISSVTQIQLLNQKVAMLEAKVSSGGYVGRQEQQPQGQGGGCGAAPAAGQGGGCGAQGVAADNQVYTIDVGSSPILGKKNSPVTIVAFLDFQCPFCNKFFPAVENVAKAYPGKVKVVIKNYPLPFHPNALPAAKLALAAGLQGKYFETVNLLLQNQASVAEEKVKEYATQLGMNYDKLMADYKNKDAQFQNIIDEEKALGEKVKVNGTPTFYINGKKTNARDLESYKVEIDKILAINK